MSESENRPQDQRDSFGRPNETLGDKIEGALDGHEDPDRGPLDRLDNGIDKTMR